MNDAELYPWGIPSTLAQLIEPPQAAILMSGVWRVSFNRHGAAPRVWSIGPAPSGLYNANERPAPRWEIAVRHVSITAPSHTWYEPKATADEDDGIASAWIQVEGLLRVLDDGTATIGPIQK